jgi:hypothetical protein
MKNQLTIAKDTGIEETQRTFVPTQQQLRYLRSYLNPAVPGNIKAVAEDAGVNRRNVYRWLDDPAFCAWFAEQCNRVFMHRVPAMWQKCIELATAGSPEHIKLVAARTGELRQAADNGRGNGIQQVFINVPRPDSEEHGYVVDVGPAVLPAPASDDEH